MTMTHGKFWRMLVGKTIKLALVCYLIICAGMFVWQRHLVFVPTQGVFDTALLTPLGYNKIAYEAEDAQQLFALYHPADHDKPTILFLHGNTGINPDRPGKYEDLARRGYGVLIASYRGFDSNDGEPSEDGIALDARAAFNLLTEGLGIDRHDIVVYGESLGTGVASRLAADLQAEKQEDVRALILDAPFTSAVALGKWRYPWLPVDTLMLDKFDTASRIADIHVPVLVMNGAKDEVVPPFMGQALFDKANQPKTFVQIPDGHHSDLYDFGAGEVVDKFLGTK